MPSKTEEYLALAQRTANGLTRYWESWTDYLTTASRLYKYPFADHVIITNHGRGESVLINIEDYAKYEEFLHQRYVAEALAKAKQQAADPDTQWADHESVWETLGKQYDV